MHTHESGFAFCNTIRWAPIAALLLLPGALCAQAADLVIHNGFEACWSSALTKPQFLDLMQTSLDGASSCIGPQSSTQNGITVTACNTNACAGGATGCPANVHVPNGAFTGDFGTGTFAGAGSMDDIVVPVTFTGTINDTCTITLSAIALAFAPDYMFSADGNSGNYAAALTQAPVSFTSYTATGSDVFCQGAVSQYGPQLKSAAEAQGTVLTEARLRSSTVAQSICPLTP